MQDEVRLSSQRGYVTTNVLLIVIMLGWTVLVLRVLVSLPSGIIPHLTRLHIILSHPSSPCVPLRYRNINPFVTPFPPSSNGTNPGLLPSSALKGFCADPNFAQEQRGCIDDVTLRTAHLQEVVFTYVPPISTQRKVKLTPRRCCLGNRTIYGVVGLMTCLLLTSLCIIDERKLTVRFAKIDEKRGGGGFV